MGTPETLSHEGRTAGLEPLLDVRGAGAVLGISRPTVYRLVERGVLRPIRIGRGIRFAPADVRELIEHQRESAP